MSNKAYKKQHIVPACYLKRFSENDWIGVEQKNGKLFKKRIHDIGYIKNYYDSPFEEDKKRWEKFLSEYIEPLYDILDSTITHATLLGTNHDFFSVDEQQKITTIIAAQWARVPDFLDECAPARIKNTNVIGKYIRSLGDTEKEKAKEFIRDIGLKAYSKELVLYSILDPEFFSMIQEIFAEKMWVLYKNTISDIAPFYTSDNPVVPMNWRLHSTDKSLNGFGSPETVIYFPISPAYAIGLFPPTFKKNWGWINNTVYEIKEDEKSLIRSLNEHIRDRCYKHVFLPFDYYNNLIKEPK